MARPILNFLPLTSALAAILILLWVSTVAGEGGIAEMKALTGDAPYLGSGNHNQAPDYFGSAVYRQYYKEAAGEPSGRGRYAYNALNGGYGGGGYGGRPYDVAGYRLSYRGYGQKVDNYGNYGPRYGSYGEPVFPRPAGGSYYTGRGNDWA